LPLAFAAAAAAEIAFFQVHWSPVGRSGTRSVLTNMPNGEVENG
jgi:hypothetical protein